LAAPAAAVAAKAEAKAASPAANAVSKQVKSEGVSNDDCLTCHDDPKLIGGAGQSLNVDPKKFDASVHAGAADCIECHTDARGDPHPEKLKPVDCAACHKDTVADYKSTTHASARAAGNTVAATCKDCHGPAHEVLASKDPKSRTHIAVVDTTCGRCHGNAEAIAKGHIQAGNTLKAYQDGIHDQTAHSGAKNAGLAPTCTSCHGVHSILAKSDPKSRVAHANVPDTCGSCHQREKDVYDKGAHGKLRQAGGSDKAPNCVDCHSAHRVKDAHLNEWQVAVAGDCGTCHADYMKSFKLTYHGKVTNLGYGGSATCASCHGAHDIRGKTDPLSPIAAANRAGTCGKCHREAGARFAGWDPHPQPNNRERSPVLYYATMFMNVLLAGVFLFFGAHTLLWAYRSLKNVAARRGGKSE
jgi:hypothetical protein